MKSQQASITLYNSTFSVQLVLEHGDYCGDSILEESSRIAHPYYRIIILLKVEKSTNCDFFSNSILLKWNNELVLKL